MLSSPSPMPNPPAESDPNGISVTINTRIGWSCYEDFDDALGGLLHFVKVNGQPVVEGHPVRVTIELLPVQDE